MRIDGFFEGAFATDLAEDEILTEIRLPAAPAGAGMAYASIEQPASGYSMVGVAAVVGRAERDDQPRPDRHDRGRRASPTGRRPSNRR